MSLMIHPVLHPLPFSTPKLHPMINRVSFKIIGRFEKRNEQGRIPLAAQAFVNKERVVISLNIYVSEKDFDRRAELVLSSHPEAIHYNSIIAHSRHMAATILAEATQKRQKLTRESFLLRFNHSLGHFNFLEWTEKEIEERYHNNDLALETYKQHKSWLKKMRLFRKEITLDDLNVDTINKLERWSKSKGHNINTIATTLKNFKAYINLAIAHYSPHGYDFKNPFDFYRIKVGQGRIVFCEIPELRELLRLYDSFSLKPHLMESLLVFLVECFTSLRISDIRNCAPHWVHQGEIRFVPKKTKRWNKEVSFPLPKVAVRLLTDLWELKRQKKLKADVSINEDLEIIGLMAGIKKKLSTHVGRHTFATTYLTMKGTERGTLEVLQQIMGHARIETTMRYVHVVDERKREQIKNFDNYFN